MKLHPVIVSALLVCAQATAISSLSAELAVGGVSSARVTTSGVSNAQINDEEVCLKPNGINTDPGWALDQIGEKFSTNTPVQVYSYPDTTTPVRLYLIDTAVREPSLFLEANPNLKTLQVINPSGGATVPRDHGTQMLSLIVGMDTGIATGTPIHVVNYDIYAGSPTADPTTSVTNLATAIAKAITHSRLPSTVPMRSVICIATSAISSGQRSSIDGTIDSALAAGITVVLSAGNLGVDATTYTPPSNGTKPGVICVGASDANNLIIPQSNRGAPVDVLAPGLAVKSRNGGALSDPIIPMTGTSPATALVAGAVLAKLSASPTFTPAGIENSLKFTAQAMPPGLPVLRSIVAPTSAYAPPDVVPDGTIAGGSKPVALSSTPVAVAALRTSSANQGPVAPAPLAIDSDADGVPDIVETFHGMPQSTPLSPVISLGEADQIQFKFPIDQNLLDSATSGNAFVLRNGYSWQIRCSSDFTNWNIPVGSLSKSTDSQGQAWLTASFPAGTQPSCFARIEIVAPPTQ